MRSWTDTCTCSAHYRRGALHMWLGCQECMEFLEACRSSFGTFRTFVCRLLKWLESINYKDLVVCSACWDQFLDSCVWSFLGRGCMYMWYAKKYIHQIGVTFPRQNSIIMPKGKYCLENASYVTRSNLLPHPLSPVRVLLGLCVRTPQVV